MTNRPARITQAEDPRCEEGWPHSGRSEIRRRRLGAYSTDAREAHCRCRGDCLVMEDMPRPRPPYLSRERTRHGKPVWYVRVEGRRTRIRAEYGTAEFAAEYQAALAGKPRTSVCSAAPGTFAWLVARYRETDAWRSLSAATRRKREQIFRQVSQSAGDAPVRAITPASIRAARERRARTPGQAAHFLYAMRGLFR
jgi:hypothetical protein